jgi:nicotinate-nucleotide pyrophosphorylase (carboxylating)
MKNLERLLSDWASADPFHDRLFEDLKGRRRQAILRSEEEGCLAGIPLAEKAAKALGLEADWKKESGAGVAAGEEIAAFRGTPQSIVRLENVIIGLLGKASGIATAARKAKKIAGGRVHLVSGGWKKHPFPIKAIIREEVAAGGVDVRLIAPPFLYLDKNFVRIFGGVGRALKAVASHSVPKVIQVRGEFGPIAEEAREAIRHGARVIMVDTGCCKDLDEVLRVLKEEKAPPGVQTAFAGGIKIEEIPLLIQKGVDVLDIGAAILDAPWLELSYDVVKE